LVPLLAPTVFLSAFSLFCLEPMVAKMILPFLGGAPAVWNTCLVFFQTALVLGYAYAHGTVALLGTRKQAFLHAVVVAVPLFLLPFHVGALAAKVRLPFVALATTAPIVQNWFSYSRREEPYFLYAASNVGSLLGLFAYPNRVGADPGRSESGTPVDLRDGVGRC
jgi:hypothetical protein